MNKEPKPLSDGSEVISEEMTEQDERIRKKLESQSSCGSLASTSHDLASLGSSKVGAAFYLNEQVIASKTKNDVKKKGPSHETTRVHKGSSAVARISEESE